MLHRGLVGSAERNSFLEDTQTNLLANLTSEPVVEALGSDTVQRIKDLNDLLIIPNIRGDSVVLPRSYRDSDKIPFLALRRGEMVTFDAEDLLPHPRQMKVIRQNLQSWQGRENTGTAAAEKALGARMSERIPAATPFQFKRQSITGAVMTSAVGIRGSELGLRDAPEEFYISVRPALGLSYSGGYGREATLLHELIHVDQSLTEPVGEPSPEARIKSKYRHELEAHHYSSRYASAVQIANRLVKLWRYPETTQHNAVENIRLKFADPDQPFEPNQQLMTALNRSGVRWGKN